MKIMHLISGGDVGGAKTQVLTMLMELSKKQNAVLVCFMDGPFAEDAKNMGIPTVILNKKNPLLLKKKICRMLNEDHYDILHCHGAKANLYGSLVRKKIRIPVISTVHSDPNLDYLGRPLANITFGMANRICLRQRDGWVAVSDAMKELLISRGYDADQIYPIYNGIPFPTHLSYRPRKEYLESLHIDWPENAVIYGIAARLNPVKDLPTLIHAFGTAAHQCDKMRLLIAGEGEQREELENLVKQVCPENTVRFVGWQTDMNSFYHCLDVNMLTSISETFPYAITEGARMHCATIATAVGGVPKVVVDGRTGFLIQPGDCKTMSERMLQLALNAKLRSALGQNIFEKVRTEFSSEVMASHQMNIYEKVIYRYFRRTQGRYGAVICGAYGKNNAGDDAILLTIIRQLRQEDPCIPICVMTRKPVDTSLMTGVSSLFIFNWLKAAKWMKKSQIYISGGGTLIQNATSTRSLFYYLSSIFQASKCGCKVVMYGCGVGPVSGKNNQRRVADILNRHVDRILLRDPESAETLGRFGVSVPPIQVTADPALLMVADSDKAEVYLQENHVAPDSECCVFVLRPWEDASMRLSAVCTAAEYGWKKYHMLPVFLCFEPGRDMKITKLAAEMLHVPYRILSPNTDGPTLCGVIGKSRLVVSMRLHALIFACSQNVRMVGISYDPKVSGFMNYVANPCYVDLQDLQPENLCRKIDDAMARKLPDHIEQVKRLSAENGRIVGEMLKKC